MKENETRGERKRERERERRTGGKTSRACILLSRLGTESFYNETFMRPGITAFGGFETLLEGGSEGGSDHQRLSR